MPQVRGPDAEHGPARSVANGTARGQPFGRFAGKVEIPSQKSSRTVRSPTSIGLRQKHISTNLCFVMPWVLVLALVQEGTLDVLDGETLYEGGWLFTTTIGLRGEDGLLHGSRGAPDPTNRRLRERFLWLGAHYGLRYNLQVGAILPWIHRDLRESGDTASSVGLGDLSLVVKWRFHRWDAPGKALNLALLAGVEAPTGTTRESDGGVRLVPELQPGSGSWDPFVGFTVTHEPWRWRFNAFVLYKQNLEGAQDYRFGSELHAEISIGNRFWLEPYPGPFMRLDAAIRWHRHWSNRDEGDLVTDSGRDVVVLAVNWAFRVRPSIDLQLEIEIPFWQRVRGIQPEQESSITFAFGYRI